MFPDDEGAHYPSDNEVTMEWWYTIYHLVTPSGREFSVMATFFMPQAEMAYRPFNITDVENEVMYDTSEWGTLEAGEGELDLVFVSDDPDVPHSTFWNQRYESGTLKPFHYEQHLHYVAPNDPSRTQSLHLKIQSMTSPYIVGDDGYVTIGDSGDSYYYSLTNLEVKGELSIDGESFEVTGFGWLDHQWGPFMLNPLPFSKNSYEWMALHLDNGQEYMVSTIFDQQNQTHREEGFGSIGWKNADCTQGISLDHTIERLAYWKHEEEGDFYSHKWHIVVPETGLDVVVEPVIDNQTVDFLGTCFYEGRSLVTGTVDGVPVTGLAFAELVHHYEVPELEIVSPEVGSEIGGDVSISWQVLNPDDGLPLTYDVVVTDSGQTETTVCEDVEETTCNADLSSFHGPIQITVWASSVDEVIKGSTTVDATATNP